MVGIPDPQDLQESVCNSAAEGSLEGQVVNATIGNTGTLKKPAQRFTDGREGSPKACAKCHSTC